MMPGSASGISTCRMICQRLAPIIATASTFPAGISRRFSSNRRAAKGTAAMVRATMAAFGPVERPVIAAVKGISAMIRMKKGKERSTLTTKPTIWLMVRTIGVTMALTVLLGLPLGIALFETDGSASPMVRTINQIVSAMVNVLRSFPFFILIIALIPFTAAITGRSTGPNAAMVALTIAAVPFAARLFELNLREIPAGKVEAVAMMGASRWQIIRQVLIPEALPGIIGSITTTTIAVE